MADSKGKALMTQGGKALTGKGSSAVAAFVARAGTVSKPFAPISPSVRTPRVVFAMDATASREPTWSRAQRVQAEMFEAMSGRGEVQLASFGGSGFQASKWAADSKALLDDMLAVRCVAGMTQVGAVLRHVAAENKVARVSAAVFVGDTLEEGEGDLVAQARRLGTLGIPLFVFHEVGNADAEPALRRIAEASGGAYARFVDGDAQGDLQPLLGAVAAYAEGGRKALLAYGERSGSEAVRRIGRQL